jgi:chromate transporter
MDRMTVTTPIKDRDQPGSAFEVLLAFAKLGVSCFGGPIAHIGYFRQEFVVRRRWLDERPYADLVALCQFLPGPASSQVGFSLGLMRAGYLGGLAAWVAFTLPSAIALVLFAYGASALEGEIGSGLLHGLKLVAVAIVAQAVWGMARTRLIDQLHGPRAVVHANWWRRTSPPAVEHIAQRGEIGRGDGGAWERLVALGGGELCDHLHSP